MACNLLGNGWQNVNHFGSYPSSVYFSSIKESYSTIDARIKCSFCCLQFPICHFSETLSSCWSLPLKKKSKDNNSHVLQREACNSSDSGRLVNFINHFRLSQIFYIGWLQLEAKYMRVSYREQKRRAKYMIVEIKSPRDKRLIRFLMVKVTGTSCACKKDDHNFRATNGDHMLEIRNSSTGSWITLLDLQVSELWARLLVSILTSITHTSFIFLFFRGLLFFCHNLYRISRQ